MYIDMESLVNLNATTVTLIMFTYFFTNFICIYCTLLYFSQCHSDIAHPNIDILLNSIPILLDLCVLLDTTALLELETQAFCNTRNKHLLNMCMWPIKFDLIKLYFIWYCEHGDRPLHLSSRAHRSSMQAPACCGPVIQIPTNTGGLSFWRYRR